MLGTMGYYWTLSVLGALMVAKAAPPTLGTSGNQVSTDSGASDVDQLKEQLHLVLGRLDRLEESVQNFISNENDREFSSTPEPLGHQTEGSGSGSTDPLGLQGSEKPPSEPGQLVEWDLSGQFGASPGSNNGEPGEGIQGLKVSDSKVTRLEAEVKHVKQSVRILAELASALATSEKNPAHIPHSNVIAKLKTAQTITCESDRAPLSSCIWAQSVNNQRQVILGDTDIVDSSDERNAGRHSIQSDQLRNGKCSLRIEKITEEDFGSWSCTLIDPAGGVLTGEVELIAEETDMTIYFGTNGGGLQAYSMETSEVKNVLSNSAYVVGVTYDPSENKLYWSTLYSIYRANRDGTEMETILSTFQYGIMYGLDFDWITGNVYASTGRGYILACKTSASPNFTCVTILSGQGDVQGIALNPYAGIMFWTEGSVRGSISRAWMDGSNPVRLATGLHEPRGLTIDFQSSRLYWTCVGDDKVQSSNMHGTNIQTVIQRPQRPTSSRPYGIALLGGRIYWTNNITKKLESRTVSGRDPRLLHTGVNPLWHLTIVPRLGLPTNRTNHCENQSCPNVCVLTPTSFKCVS